MIEIFWTPKMSLADVEKQIIKAAYNHYEGNIFRVSACLKISRFALLRRMRKYGLSFGSDKTILLDEEEDLDLPIGKQDLLKSEI